MVWHRLRQLRCRLAYRWLHAFSELYDIFAWFEDVLPEGLFLVDEYPAKPE